MLPILVILNQCENMALAADTGEVLGIGKTLSGIP